MQILPDDQIRLRIQQVQNQALPEEQRQQARNEVVDSMLRIIPFVIKKLPGTGIRPEELVGEAFETINSCIDKFDSNHISPRTEDKTKFSSYVFAALESNLRNPRTVVQAGRPAIPVYVEDISGLMKHARELFMQEEHREPSEDEWYKRTVRLAGEKWSVSTLRQVTPETFDVANRARFAGRARIDSTVGKGNIETDSLKPLEGAVADTLIDESEDTFEAVAKTLLEEDIYKLLGSLKQRERTVLELRFGIGLNEEGKPKKPLTLEEVAKLIGVTRERIRQIEGKALRVLRHPSRSEKIRDYADLERYEPDKAPYEFRYFNYDSTLSLVSDRMMTRINRAGVVDYLKKLRAGLKSTGMIDPELLAEFFDKNDINVLKYREKQLRVSSRTLAGNLLDAINTKIVDVHDQKIVFVDKDKNVMEDCTYYWMRAPIIEMNEIIKNTKKSA